MAQAMVSGRNPLWTPTELADYLRLPPGTLDQWASRGIGPRSLRVGRHRRYRDEDVKVWIDEQAAAGRS